MRVGAALAKVGVSAHLLTLTSLVFAAGVAATAAQGWFGAAAALLMASGACDLLDGIVARAQGSASRFGALLDSTVDRVADALPLLGLVVAFAKDGPIVAVPASAMTGVFAVSYVRARADALGVTLPPLFMRRPERVVLLILALLLADVGATWDPVRAPLTLALVAVLGALSAWSTVAALRWARVALERTDSTAAPERLTAQQPD
jgi:CDP-diacylglycerol--glycerol-3-phosphate 3-phosphatidyltransferase